MNTRTPHTEVAVTIDGRRYRMACGVGEHDHVQALAVRYNARIQSLYDTIERGEGERGENDTPLHIMAALTVLDEASEAEARVHTLQAEIESLRSELTAQKAEHQDFVTHSTHTVQRLSQEVEQLVGLFHAESARDEPSEDV
jgi:cell division protein ZapA